MDKVTVHLRNQRSNNAKAKTLCGLWIHDQRCHEHLAGKKTIRRGGPVPEEYVHQVHSMFETSAKAFEGELNWKRVLPDISPSTPPLRAIDYCEACWDHPVRAIKLLNKTDL